MVFGEVFITWAQHLILQYSYAAIFFLSFIGTSTIFVPFPLDIFTSSIAGAGLNPLLVGIVVGFGSASGELIGYLIGMGGRTVVVEKKKKTPKLVNFFNDLFEKHKDVRVGHRYASVDIGFVVILVTSYLPFPFDIIGLLSGISKYDIKKFYIAVLIGKTLKAITFAYFGYLIIPVIGDLTGWF